MVYNFAPLIQTDMLTREQIEEIQDEAREKGTAIKALLKEKGIPEHQYFWWKRKYARAEVPEGFLPIAGGGICRIQRKNEGCPSWRELDEH